MLPFQFYFTRIKERSATRLAWPSNPFHTTSGEFTHWTADVWSPQSTREDKQNPFIYIFVETLLCGKLCSYSFVRPWSDLSVNRPYNTFPNRCSFLSTLHLSTDFWREWCSLSPRFSLALLILSALDLSLQTLRFPDRKCGALREASWTSALQVYRWDEVHLHSGPAAESENTKIHSETIVRRNLLVKSGIVQRVICLEM